MPNRIAYFVNQYPAVSHSFIRREVLALEALGFEVVRVALRGWQGELVDEIDYDERAATRYLLRNGVLPVMWAMVRAAIYSPRRFFAACTLATRMGLKGGRSLPFHIGYLAEACRMAPWLRSAGVTHVHAHFGTNSAEVVMLAHELGGPPYSFTVHGPDEFDMPGPLGIGEKVARSAFTVAITSYARAQLYRWVPHQHWPKVKVIHCGLERAYYESEAVPIPSQARLVCIGRLSEQKGQLLLVEATRRLRERGMGFQLVLVGSGPMREQLDRLVSRYGLADHVRLTGAISLEDLKEEIRRARALVLPSFAEGLPMVIMEAMALRRPVLSTFVAGIPELVVPGENGWLIPAGSVEALEETMMEIIEAPVERLQEMGDAGYERVRDRHSVEIQAEMLSQCFQQSGGCALNDQPVVFPGGT